MAAACLWNRIGHPGQPVHDGTVRCQRRQHGRARSLLDRNPGGTTTRRVILAEVGSLSLEFTRLAQLTGKAEYYHAVRLFLFATEKPLTVCQIQRITDVLDSDDWKSPQRLGKLFPTVRQIPSHPSKTVDA